MHKGTAAYDTKRYKMIGRHLRECNWPSSPIFTKLQRHDDDKFFFLLDNLYFYFARATFYSQDIRYCCFSSKQGTVKWGIWNY